jgi:hypothetical protein
MLGSGSQVVCILIDLNTALKNCSIVVPLVKEHSKCEIAQDVSNIPVSRENSTISFEGSSIFISSPVLRNIILTSKMKDPFELIPLMRRTARDFDLAQIKKSAFLLGNAVTHSDDLNTWLYGANVGLITRKKILCHSRQHQNLNFLQKQTHSVHYLEYNNAKCSRNINY